jgi:hypothetical protein
VSTHHFAAQNDGACAQEADSRHDLCRDARRIKDDIARFQYVGEAEGRNDHEQAGADTNQHMGAQAWRPCQPFAIGADDAAEYGGDQKAQDQIPVQRGHDGPQRFNRVFRCARPLA